MTQMTLTSEQATLLTSSSGPVLLVDPSGKPVGQAASKYSHSRFTAAQLAEAREELRQGGRGISTAELLEKLHRLTPQ